MKLIVNIIKDSVWSFPSEMYIDTSTQIYPLKSSPLTLFYTPHYEHVMFQSKHRLFPAKLPWIMLTRTRLQCIDLYVDPENSGQPSRNLPAVAHRVQWMEHGKTTSFHNIREIPLKSVIRRLEKDIWFSTGNWKPAIHPPGYIKRNYIANYSVIRCDTRLIAKRR